MKRFVSALGGLVGLVVLSVLAGVLVTLPVLPYVAVSAAGANDVLDAYDELPDELVIDQLMLPTTIYAVQDGEPVELAKFYEQNRVPVTLDEVSPFVVDALVAAEDPRFFEHGGVDFQGLVRALANNAGGGELQGGSSIPQQYVKNVLLQRCEAGSQSPEELHVCSQAVTATTGTEGLARKVQEMRYAATLSQTYSKGEVLEGYLNILNMGGSTYGIEAAARYYFGVSAKDLTLGQAATLVGMGQNPNALRIDRDVAGNSAADGWAAAKERQLYVLGRMLEEGFITPEEYEKAAAEPIAPVITPVRTGCAQAEGAEYFCQYVVNEIRTNAAFGESAEERAGLLRRGGLEVYTTLDVSLQQVATSSMSTHVPSTLPGMDLGGASVTVETDTGRILSLTQNTTFTEEPDAPAGQTGLVYAADYQHGGSIGFPAGSTYKLFTLIEWLENGHSLKERVNGTLRTFSTWKCDDVTRRNSTLIKNFENGRGYWGDVVRFTADSLNTGFLAMATQLDVCAINRTAERMGVHTGTGESPAATNNLYDVLGSKNIAPLQMATAFATVANAGIQCEPRAIDRVVTSGGDEIDLGYAPCERAISEDVAAAATVPLQAVMTAGSARMSNPWDGVPILGKTGTHESFQTTLVSSTTKATTVVWVGNATGAQNLYRTYANGNAVAYLRHAVTKDIMSAANAEFGGDAFPAAPDTMTRDVKVRVPNVVGLTQDAATQLLVEGEATVHVTTVASPYPRGTVISQTPTPDEEVAAPPVVTLVVSDGEGVLVPDVAGLTPTEAERELKGVGLTSTLGISCYSQGVRVTTTVPAAGESVASDTDVALRCA